MLDHQERDVRLGFVDESPAMLSLPNEEQQYCAPGIISHSLGNAKEERQPLKAGLLENCEIGVMLW
jgi:hypothetical protein